MRIEAANRKRSLEDKETQENLDREIANRERELQQARTKFPVSRLAGSATGIKGKGKERAIEGLDDREDEIMPLPPLPSPPLFTMRSAASAPETISSSIPTSSLNLSPLERVPSAPSTLSNLPRRSFNGSSSGLATSSPLQRIASPNLGVSTPVHSRIRTDMQRRQLQQVFDSLVDHVSRNEDNPGEEENSFAREFRMAIQSALDEPGQAEESPAQPPQSEQIPVALTQAHVPRPTLTSTPAQAAEITLQQNNNPWRNGTYLKYIEGAGSRFIVELEGSTPHHERP